MTKEECENKTKNSRIIRNDGITIIALVITIIVLIILAGVSLSAVFSEKGIFKRTEDTANMYNEAKAREVLETVLIGIAQYEKRSNPAYDKVEFLNKLIKDEIEGARITGDIVIVGEYAFKINRNVPEIAENLGLAGEIENIPTSVEYETNGSNEWKKSHSTKIIIKDENDKAVSSKYQWTNNENEPADNTFINEFKSGDTITEDGLTGTHFLWTMIETQSGKKIKEKSGEFNFDNTVPTATLTATGVTDSSIKLDVTARDNDSGITKIEFFVDNVSKKSETIEATNESITKSFTVTGLSAGTHSCKVVVTDVVGKTCESTQNVTLTTITYSTSTNATSYRGNNGKTYQIAIEGSSSGTVWGSGPYTDDSNIAKAAVHAGIVKIGEKKIVTIKILADQGSYSASTKNGITTSSYGTWHGSYEFVK